MKPINTMKLGSQGLIVPAVCNIEIANAIVLGDD